ncbi:hypothetical protein KI387_037113, partial [Taxus chinensis]
MGIVIVYHKYINEISVGVGYNNGAGNGLQSCEQTRVPVDPLEWQVSQEAASGIAEFMANTVGAAESVFRVAASGHDKKLFFKVVLVLYVLSAVGRAISGATIAYT